MAAIQNFLSGGLQGALAQALGGAENFGGAAQPQAMAPEPKRRGFLGVGSTGGNVLGAIGDALLIGTGNQPIYRGRLREHRVNEALQNYLSDPDAAIAELMKFDAPAGIGLHQQREAAELARRKAEQKEVPAFVAELREFGIDPQSPEGRQYLERKYMKEGATDPTFVRELAALGIDPRSEEALRLYYARNSPAGYLIEPEGRREGGPAQELPVVGSQEQYDALPPGTRYRDSQGNVGMKGGATGAGSSPGFPGS